MGDLLELRRVDDIQGVTSMAVAAVYALTVLAILIDTARLQRLETSS